MFGYVLPAKADMRIRDFESYRTSYCGLCKQLGKSYGVFSRFLLNYDLVLLAIVSDALSGEVGQVRNEGCFAGPLSRRQTRHGTPGLGLAADGLVLLSYHKLRDDLADNPWGKRLLYSLALPFMKPIYRDAAACRPGVDAVLKAEMQRQQQLEAAKSSSVDEACDPTAKMCAALFREAGQTEEQKRILERLGLFAGQIVYLLDAAEDYTDDAASGSYNVFITAGLSRQEAIEQTRHRCNLAAGEIALCYNLLPFRQYKPILDNIFFLGLPNGIAMAGTKRTQRRPKHGEIESL